MNKEKKSYEREILLVAGAGAIITGSVNWLIWFFVLPWLVD